MDKMTYDLLYNCTPEPETEMNEPFCFMKAEVALKNKSFTIWNKSYKHQHIHAHDYYQIWYILRGNCTHRIDNSKFRLGNGDMIIIPPYSYHSMADGSDDLIVIGVDFTDGFFSDTDANKNLMAYCINPIFLKHDNTKAVFFADNNIENLLIEMFDEFTHKNPFYDTVIKSNLSKILVILSRTINYDIPNTKNQRAIAEVLKYIHSNLTEKIQIEDLCKISKMSETLLSTSFKRSTDKNIIEYINSLKINKAKQLLAETDMRVVEIAYELGFSDGSYFNRVFKKFVGMTPHVYRREKRR